MKRITSVIALIYLIISGVGMLSGCQGIMSGIYDDPIERLDPTKRGQLYIDASAWDKWHYVDITASLPQWQSYGIPDHEADTHITVPQPEETGIYTYWFDIYGSGTSDPEYQGFTSTAKQVEPDQWTIAVHRNNVRTNGCGVHETLYTSIEHIPRDAEWLQHLDYTKDEWNQTSVWTVRDRMLSGIIGNQGIYVNNVLSGWLNMIIPPMPPSFSLNNHVFILKLSDGTYAALQLSDYISTSGNKCCLTINYKYPL